MTKRMKRTSVVVMRIVVKRPSNRFEWQESNDTLVDANWDHQFVKMTDYKDFQRCISMSLKGFCAMLGTSAKA